MKNEILVFAATYNESENIKDFLNSIETLNLELDLLLIDDNSPDKTWKIIQEYAKNKNMISDMHTENDPKGTKFGTQKQKKEF